MKNILSSKVRRQLVGISFILPAIILLTVFLIYPFFMSFKYSFTDYNILNPDKMKFIGVDNYVKLAQDEIFKKSIINTFHFVILVVPLQLVLGLAFALLLQKNFKGIALFRLSFFSPTILSLVVISILWLLIYNPNNGLLNSILDSLGLPQQPFLTSSNQAMNCIIVLSAWQGAGFQMMIYLSGLQNIPEYLYEAAKLDGASNWQTFKNITLPSLKNTSVFLILTITISAFQLLVQPMQMTQGGPLNSTMTILYEMYQYGYKYRKMGYGSAMTVVFVALVLIIALIQKKIITEKD